MSPESRISPTLSLAIRLPAIAMNAVAYVARQGFLRALSPTAKNRGGLGLTQGGPIPRCFRDIGGIDHRGTF